MDKQNKLNEVLKERERKAAEEKAARADEPMKLDDASRVKVLSPGMLVFKRFIRNKLAILGSGVLVFMFLFAFIGPLFYPYDQTETFYKYDYINADYASAVERTEYTNYILDDTITIDSYVVRSISGAVTKMESEGAKSTTLVGKNDGVTYEVTKLGDGAYQISLPNLTEIATYVGGSEIAAFTTLGNKLTMNDGSEADAGLAEAIAGAVQQRQTEVTYDGMTYSIISGAKMQYKIATTGGSFSYAASSKGADFETAVLGAIESGAAEIEVGDESYQILTTEDGYRVVQTAGAEVASIATTLVFDSVNAGGSFSNEFKTQALAHMYTDGKFTADGNDYKIVKVDGDLMIKQGDAEVAMISSFVVRDTLGQDSLDLGFKEAVAEQITYMEENGLNKLNFTHLLPAKITEIDEAGNQTMITQKDADGNVIYEETDMTITQKTGQYMITCEQMTHLIDLDAAPSSEHIFGTDGDGYDVLARMMYGGRISLMVGFVVVILETILGVIMGGIAGYFGGWVDNLIMRLVDIFYCVPSTPLLIILGGFMDAAKLGSYARLMWMMAILGILGWASIARLVRGQILSLREQEFMVATEATGVRVNRRIFRHLVPNVMPQLIVAATMGLGSVILTESTLSFLGLGVKHPLATWGTMINSVTQSNENMIQFTYIWIPVGMLICLTVIAFNFVGDGLRDAFDPKMKR